MKVLLTGATGFVGSHLARRLESSGHVVMPVSRRPAPGAGTPDSGLVGAPGNGLAGPPSGGFADSPRRGLAGAPSGGFAGSARRGFDWSEASLERGVREADAIVHLAGENLIAKRWTSKQKQILRSSRIDTTRRLAALAAKRRPACMISASAVGFYGPSESGVFDETAPRGSGFLADLCGDWEDATEAAAESGVRTAVVRIGMVLGPGGGPLAKMLPIFRLGLGGPLGSGRQWVSWVHVDDLCALFVHLLESDSARGAFNGTAPGSVTMRDLARTLGRVLHRPAVLPAPAPMMRLALGEVAGVLLTGQNVRPRRALEAGFRFEHPELEPALVEILRTPERSIS